MSAPHSLLTRFWQLLKQAGRAWADDNGPQLGAALAFYSALSIAPLLVILLGVAAVFYGAEAAAGQVSEQAKSLMGPEGSHALQDLIKGAAGPNAGKGAALLSLATLLFSASAAFSELQASLNKIWRVQYLGRHPVWRVVRDRLFAFVVVMAIAALLVASMVASAAVASLSTFVEGMAPAFRGFAQLADFGAAFVITMLLFAILFKLLPEARVDWGDVWVGAAVTAVLFGAGKYAIGVYLAKSNMAVSYGVASSFVALLIWIYYSAQILYFGAELTHAYATREGSQSHPA